VYGVVGGVRLDEELDVQEKLKEVCEINDFQKEVMNFFNYCRQFRTGRFTRYITHRDNLPIV
jgi:hypothetical protein